MDESALPAQVKPTVEYTALGHASKFVQPGAKRIESNTFGPGSIESVAFQNPDGSIALIVLNSGDSAAPFNIAWRGEFLQYRLRGGEAATFVWNDRSVK